MANFMKKKTKLLIIFCAAILLNIVMNVFGNALQIERYSVVSDKLTEPVRIIFISDLHNCTYGGDDYSDLWEIFTAEEPDMILFGGDVIDYKSGTKHALRLMEMTQEVYPCAYASGNHEVRHEDTEEFYEAVEMLDVPVLHGNDIDVTVNGQELRISGVVNVYDEPDQLETCCQSFAEDRYNILLAHQPEQFDAILSACTDYDTAVDLVLSGHAHGGQWRIPKLLEHGLYAPDQGIFPEFTCGQRECDGTVQIVSRGMAKPFRMILIPRIFNQPELSVIEILPEESE